MTEEKFDPRPLRDVMRESEAARLRQEYLNGKEIVITEPTGTARRGFGRSVSTVGRR